MGKLIEVREANTNRLIAFDADAVGQIQRPGSYTDYIEIHMKDQLPSVYTKEDYGVVLARVNEARSDQ